MPAEKILITYASRAGSTAGVATAIYQTLTDYGLQAELRSMDGVHDLTPYRAVVAGSAIRFDHWLPEAMDFMTRHQAELSRKPFALFVVCLAMATQNPRRLEKAKQTVSAWLQPVRNLVSPVSEGLFAGALNLSQLPLIYRIPFRLATLTGIFAEGDYRNWAAIRDWAAELPAIFESA
jgi:menaquinone-dependent protoporphyrinogen oxidase